MALMADSMQAELSWLNTLQLLISEKANADSIMKANVTVSSTFQLNHIYFYYEFKCLLIFVFIGGGYCNFMHPKHVSRDLKRQLFKQMYDEHPEYREHRRE